MSGSVEIPTCVTARAWAKINLTLDVFEKRADGFHGIESVMQAISLHDTLRITRRKAPGICFTCDAPESIRIPTDGSNLVVRAAEAALCAAATAGKPLSGGLVIHLTKRIPAQAGLGGGSSDAAAALRSVDALSGFTLSCEVIHELAASLGSDVAFFLTGGTAVARGRGEAIAGLPDFLAHWLVIVKPEANVSTAWAYGALDAIATRVSTRATGSMEEAIRCGDRGRMMSCQSNDFELPVFSNIRSISRLQHDFVDAGAQVVHLCGSGSAVFGMTESALQAEEIAVVMRGKYPDVFVARTLTRTESDVLS